ncbi:MAG: hypothetical protein GY765_29725 [bacterium]|nr:hypothetical protein [bacterium]
MNKSITLIVLLLLLPLFNRALHRNLKLVNVIEDNDMDLALVRFSGAVITPSREIIISDSKTNCVAKFNWEGKLIKKVGQLGKGPGDLSFPQSVHIFDGNVYVHDMFNSRIAVMNEKLENFRYLRISENVGFCKSFKMAGPDTFLTSPLNGNAKKDGGSIVVFNGKAEIVNNFFTHLPFDKSGLNTKSQKSARRMAMYSMASFGIDDKKENLLITFLQPDNPVKFFLYDMKGKQLKEFQQPIDKKYAFPRSFLERDKWSLDMLKDHHAVETISIFFCSGHWYVFLDTKYYRKYNDCDHKYMYFKFTREGEFVGKYENAEGFLCLHVSPDGYVVGRALGLEIQQLKIYQAK